MSKTKKGSKSSGQEYWGKRPLKHISKDVTGDKRTGIQRERAILKAELAKEPTEPYYDEQEYVPHCPECAKGTCPMYKIAEDGTLVQLGVNGDWDIY